MTSKETAIDLFMTHFDRYVRDQIMRTNVDKAVSISMSFEEDEGPNAEKVRKFIGETISQVVKEAFDAKYSEVQSKVKEEINAVFSELVTEQEADKICEIMASETAKKILRNIDLIGDACSVGMEILGAEVHRLMTSAEQAEKFQSFIKSLMDS